MSWPTGSTKFRGRSRVERKSWFPAGSGGEGTACSLIMRTFVTHSASSRAAGATAQPHGIWQPLPGPLDGRGSANFRAPRSTLSHVNALFTGLVATDPVHIIDTLHPPTREDSRSRCQIVVLIRRKRRLSRLTWQIRLGRLGTLGRYCCSLYVSVLNTFVSGAVVVPTLRNSYFEHRLLPSSSTPFTKNREP
jgi:hypothetical protein